jgi:hypothetical protein
MSSSDFEYWDDQCDMDAVSYQNDLYLYKQYKRDSTIPVISSFSEWCDYVHELVQHELSKVIEEPADNPYERGEIEQVA